MNESENAREQSSDIDSSSSPVQKGVRVSQQVRGSAIRLTELQRAEESSLLGSPVILTLGAFIALLVLLILIYLVYIFREYQDQALEVAENLRKEGKVRQAIIAYDDFLKDYGLQHAPNKDQTPLVLKAKLDRAEAMVDLQLDGSVPNWNEGLNKLRNYISEIGAISKVKGFENELENRRDIVVGAAKKIALGAAKQAGQDIKREFLVDSDNGVTLVSQYSNNGGGKVLEDFFELVRDTRRASEEAIIKQEVLEMRLENIDLALDLKDTFQTLQEHRRLINRYPDLVDHKEVRLRKQRVIEMEGGLVQIEKEVIEAITGDALEQPQPLTTLLGQSRSDSSVRADGYLVIGWAKDCCYGIESQTGEPRWRRVVGENSPFFPLEIVHDQASLLVFDTNKSALVLLERQTGKPLWMQPAVDDVQGTPVVHNGSIYITGNSRSLWQVDSETGIVRAHVRFPQPIIGPVVISQDRAVNPATGAGLKSEQYLILPGEQDFFYTLQLNPLACVKVSDLGQKPGALATGILRLGPYLLACENEGNATEGYFAKIRLIDASQPDQGLTQKDIGQVTGLVKDPPLLWGRYLLVPSRPERLTVFSVSDEIGQKPLAYFATREQEPATDTHQYLLVGSEGEVWVGSEGVYKLDLAAGAMVEDLFKNPIQGRITQPLTKRGGQVYAVRTMPTSDASAMLQIDRDEKVSRWKTTLAARPLVTNVTENGRMVILTESGHVFRFNANRIDSDVFITEFQESLPISGEWPGWIEARPLAEDEFAVWTMQQEGSRLWLLDRLGNISHNISLEEPLEAAPIQLGSQIVLPLAGRLKVVSSQRQRRSKRITDYLQAQGEVAAAPWLFLQVLSEQDFVAVDQSGGISRFQITSGSKKRIRLVNQTQLPAEPAPFWCRNNSYLVFVHSRGSVEVYDPQTLENIRSWQITGQTIRSVSLVRDQLLVQLSDQTVQLHHLAQGSQLNLDDTTLPDSPFVTEMLWWKNSIVVVQQNGTVSRFDPKSGTLLNQFQTGQPVVTVPIIIADRLFVCSWDGSFYAVPWEIN